MFQRKKHPKYRKPMSKEEKYKIKQSIRLKEKQNLKKILYSLPLDLKKKIYYMAVQSHLIEWSLSHKLNFSDINLVFQEKEKDDSGMWLCIDEWDIFSHKHICYRNVKKRGQPGIQSIYVPPNPDYEIIDGREWANKDNYYWTHVKCRCKMCDQIRIIGCKHSFDNSLWKYQNIEWPIWSEQWITKSKNQVKYEKNILRNIQRKQLKKVKDLSLLENK
jgi:hypothetical protein